MKKFLILFCLIYINRSAFAQSPRTQLIEEFYDDYNAQMPALEASFNNKLATTSANYLLLKYVATSQPYSQLAAQTGYLWINRRGKYHYTSADSLPYGFQDGHAFIQPGRTDTGKLYNLSQADLSARALVSSPFDLQITHGYTTFLDSFWVQAVIHCTQGYIAHHSATGKIKLHMILAEKKLHFIEPSGPKSALDYEHVAVTDMPYYSTTLRDTFVNGSYDTIKYQVDVHDPDFRLLLDLSQLEVVAYIQDEGYGGQQSQYTVLQAAYSAPLPILPGMGDVGIRNITAYHGNCMTQVQPQFMLTNYGTTTVTSVWVTYTTSNYATMSSTTWTGTMQPGDSAIVSFSPITLNLGPDSLTGIIQQVNGNNTGTIYNAPYTTIKDYNVLNNFADKLGYVDYMNLNPVVNSQYLHYDEVDIHDNLNGMYFYVPEFNSLLDFIGNYNTINYYGSYGKSDQSILFYFNYYPKQTTQKVDNSIVTEKLDMHDQSNIGMRFDYGYSRRDAQSTDSLIIQVSTDCGDHFQDVSVLTGNVLSTARDTVVKDFLPKHSEWKTIWIDLSAYDYSPSMIIKMKGVYGGGNNLYIDKINIGANVLGIEEPASSQAIPLQIWPNPASDEVQLNGEFGTLAALLLYASNGQEYKVNYTGNAYQLKLDVSKLAAGLYFVETQSQTGIKQHCKLVKQ